MPQNIDSPRSIHDVIVVGLGAMGSAAAQHLAERGQRVLALEQFAPLHSFGSSHGNSRMIRQSYWEHPAYVPLLLRAYELWERLEHDTARTGPADAADLLHLPGGLVLGHRESSHAGPDDFVARSRLAAEEHGLPHEILSGPELRRRFPQFAIDPDTYALFEARAGYLRAGHCLRAQLAAATAAGADLRFHTPVLSYRSLHDGTVEVTTHTGTHRTAKLVLTAGPWATELLSTHAGASYLTVTRQVLFWLRSTSFPELFREPACPVYIVAPEPGSPAGTPVLYGFPETPDDSGTVKVAIHGSHDIVPPAALDKPGIPGAIDRTCHPHEVESIRARLRPAMPALAEAPLARAETCLYTMTPDEHFLVDLHPDNPNIVLAAGFSGHGFKFANLIGEILADLALTGSTRHPIDLFRLARFSRADS